MPAGILVNISMPPGIIRYFALEIGTLPVLRVPWLLDQIRKAVLAFRIVAVIDLERVERNSEGGNLRLRGGNARLFCSPRELRNHDGREDSKNDKNEQQFDESKAPSLEARFGSFMAWVKAYFHKII